ncbi:MAG: hypothetical protein II930_08635 [Lachnospiraceae bacterium]|nr:hypothetical protein [Lachnospiraceae bacterium]
MKNWKRVLALVLALCMIFGLTACMRGATQEETTTLMVANPVKEFDTLEAAVADSGTALNVTMAIDAQPSGYATIGQIVEITYGDGAVVVRKAPGNEDVSGDYNTYAVTKQLDVNGKYVTVKGPAEGAWNQILWLGEDVTYSVYVKEAVNDEAVAAWVASVK